MDLPRVCSIAQQFALPPKLDLKAALEGAGAEFSRQIQPGAKIAVAVGSRGIANLPLIVRSVVRSLQSAGAIPFIVPAMGSHGGATPEGQEQLLAGYGITEREVGAPIRPSLEVEQIGATSEGIPVFFSREALRADGIILINRVKPHTDFSGKLGSGLIKMIVVGLGKRKGAGHFHVAASKLGHEPVLRSIMRVAAARAPILGGLALVENQFHQTARAAWVSAAELENAEEKLFREARDLMPRLPFDQIDLLIVDGLGKNISGAGMDPNITGRGVQGYSSALSGGGKPKPSISRIFVRDLTPETHGNAIGIGLADLTTSRLVRAMDKEATYINALTSLTPHTAKVPIHFETDREAIGMALASLGLESGRDARVVRIADTLSLGHLVVSESYHEAVSRTDALTIKGEMRDMDFDTDGNLFPLSALE